MTQRFTNTDNNNQNMMSHQPENTGAGGGGEWKLEKLMESPLYEQYHRYKEAMHKHQLEKQRPSLFLTRKPQIHIQQQAPATAAATEIVETNQPTTIKQVQQEQPQHFRKIVEFVGPLIRANNKRPYSNVKTYHGLHPWKKSKKKKKKFVYPSPRFTLTSKSDADETQESTAKGIGRVSISKADADESDFALKPTASVILGNPRPLHATLMVPEPVGRGPTAAKKSKGELKKVGRNEQGLPSTAGGAGPGGMKASEQAPNVAEVKKKGDQKQHKDDDTGGGEGNKVPIPIKKKPKEKTPSREEKVDKSDLKKKNVSSTPDSHDKVSLRQHHQEQQERHQDENKEYIQTKQQQQQKPPQDQEQYNLDGLEDDDPIEGGDKTNNKNLLLNNKKTAEESEFAEREKQFAEKVRLKFGTFRLGVIRIG